MGELSECTGVISTSHAVLPQRVKRQRGAKVAGSDDGERKDASGTPLAAARPENAEGPGHGGQLAVPASDSHLKLVFDLFDDVRTTSEKATRQFEYLDHTADVQLHAWGKTLSQSFEQVALCMFNYMTPLEGIESGLRERLVNVSRGGDGQERQELTTLAGDPGVVRMVRIGEAKDMDSLMFQWLDEFLFGFNTEYFVPVRIRVVDFQADVNGGKFGIAAVAVGGVFDAQRDVCGTEIKAITYSAMQILDVCAASESGEAGGVGEGKDTSDRMTPRDRSDVYVIVDI